MVACVSWLATPETLGVASPWVERFQITRVLVSHVKNKHPLLSGVGVGVGDSSVTIATRYGLDCPGFESLWGSRFSAPVQTVPGAHPAPYEMGTGSFPRVKRQGRGVDHPPPSSAAVEGRVELYIFPPSEPSWLVLG
jgi:hypothetical protein